ncbi:hypothetical protein [Novosphingobium sp. CCH12-A3]|uniref:hypothetical protein n=1 Tax=Novosphingobium sp. CCH12-A3 TaxID=1768752 RepID=UPI0007840911|nr:hypothetical protein [Novosphingobium sp. CCH12-A3]
MTHPLVAFLKTPMAAPETRTLRSMRRLWMALCWALALAVMLLPVLKALLGPWAGLPALLLGLAALLHGLVYFRAKARADDVFGREVRP